MGQNSSVPLSGRRKSFRNSWRPRFPPRSRSYKGNLSATFNILDVDTKIDQLNVNLASEEELMTLPGVSRTDAHNIVEYRQRLGRFKKVEDLALVSGIGADKLALIRPEICVGPRRSPSCASSRAQSIDSLPSVDAKPSPRPILLTNINTATVFDLQAISGFTQEIAANVVDYRDKHGTFTNLDQLTKVKGINHIRLGAIRSRLTVTPEPNSVPVRNGYAPSFNVVHSTPKSSPKIISSQSSQPLANGKISGHRKSLSVPVKFGPASNGLAVRDILDVLSACSPRPIVEDYFDGKRKGRAAVRIATWNLSGLSHDKVENPGVKEVICRTILENRFSLISLQDILSEEALEKVWSELNFPTLRRVKEWKENSHKWHYQSCKGLGFLWDESDQIALSAINVEKLFDATNDTSVVLLADFMIGNLDLSVANIHVHESIIDNSPADIATAIDKLFSKHQNNNGILMGDFSCFYKQAEAKYGIIKGIILLGLLGCCDIFGTDFKPVLPLKVGTNSVPLNHHSTDNSFNDNIYLNKSSNDNFTDMSGVVRQGLTHLAIPRNWSWGGPASEHCPVWCELYIEKNSLPLCVAKKS